MKKKFKLELDYDLETVLVCALRYCIGRRTYMPSLITGYIIPLLPHLTIDTLNVMRQDILNADELGNENIDAPIWLGFLNHINKQLEHRT